MEDGIGAGMTGSGSSTGLSALSGIATAILSQPCLFTGGAREEHHRLSVMPSPAKDIAS